MEIDQTVIGQTKALADDVDRDLEDIVEVAAMGRREVRRDREAPVRRPGAGEGGDVGGVAVEEVQNRQRGGAKLPRRRRGDPPSSLTPVPIAIVA